MSIQNSEIALLIKKARQERNMSQKQLAYRLQKTSVSISDMERGKVKISASELSIIAEILNKPIEYFFGEEFGGQEIQDFISVFRKSSPEQQAQSLKTAKMIIAMQELADKYKDGIDQKPTNDEMKRLFSGFVDFRDYINDLTDQFNGISWQLKRSLEAEGIIDKT